MSALSDMGTMVLDKRQFTIRACLGRGGFGEVYRASMTNATGLEADVAVKVLHTDLETDAQAVQRLRDEGRMLGALVHPSIVRVYDLVVLDGRVGLVTEYVEGQDLSACIRGDAPMPPRALAAVIGRVADALHAAWTTPGPEDMGPLQLIHRDVKPPNIRIGVQGAVKLLDFGVARSSKMNREAHTSTGHMVGSYLYMAPECLLENAFAPPSDIFALGATTYEALAAERLYADQSLRELYVMVLKDDEYQAYIDERLALLNIPPAMAALLRRMLAREPDDRPDAPTVSATCDDLVDQMEGPTLRRWCKARSWPAPNLVPGMLDGRTITEATMASSRPDFAIAPPQVRRPINWTAWLSGTVVLVAVTLAGLFALLVLVVALVNSGSKQTLMISPPDSPPIDVLQTGITESPSRTENRTDGTAAGPRRPAAPRSRTSRVSFDAKGKDIQISLSRNGKSHGNMSSVGYGTYTLYADFGRGFVRKGSVDVDSPTTRISCNALLQSCSAE